MFCQKCGKDNSDDAAFCNSCGASLTKKSAPNSAYIQLKQNEIRLLQEKFNSDSSNIGPNIMVIVIVVLEWCNFVFVPASDLRLRSWILVVTLLLFCIWLFWRFYSKPKAAKKTEIQLYAAKAELERMKNA